MNYYSNVGIDSQRNFVGEIQPDEPEGLSWQRHAEELGKWAMGLASRTDAYGAYYVKFDELERCEVRQTTIHQPLTEEVLYRHFRGVNVNTRVGLHTTSIQDTVKFIVADLDNDKDPDENWKRVKQIDKECRRHYIRPIIEASNGKGRVHIWLLFTEFAARDAFAFGRWLVRDFPDVEVFPKQPSIGKSWGNFVRLPGRHHKNATHWSKFWDGERWLAGSQAVQYLLNSPVHHPRLIPDEAKAFQPVQKQPDWQDNGFLADSDGHWMSNFSGDLHTLDIVSLFDSRGLWVRQETDGRHLVYCPWANEHSGEPLAYIFPSETVRPGFKCWHAHCEGRKLRAVCEWFGKEEVDRCCSVRFLDLLPDTDNRIDAIFQRQDQPLGADNQEASPGVTEVVPDAPQANLDDPRTAYLWQGRHALPHNVNEHDRQKRAASVREAWEVMPQSGFFPEFMSSFLPTTDAPVWFLVGAALATASQFLNRRVTIKNGGRTIYPNVWVGLFGLSGQRKSTCVNIARQLIQDDPEYIDTALTPDTTWAAFALQMGHKVERDQRGEPDFSACREMLRYSLPSMRGLGTMLVDEMSGWFKSLESSVNMGFKEVLTTMYDCPPELAKRTKEAGSYLLWRPWLSILGASSIEWLTGGAKKRDIAGGFLARWLMLVSTKVDYKLLMCDPPDDTHKARLLDQINRLKELSGEMKLSTDAEIHYCEWGKKLQAADAMLPMLNRYSDYALKLSAIFQASQSSDMVIALDSMTRATAFLDRVLANLGNFVEFHLSDSDWERDYQTVARVVREAGTIDKSTLLRNSHMKTSVLTEILERLVMEQSIAIEQGKERVKPTRISWIRKDPDSQP